MSLTATLDRHPHAKAVLESAVPPAGNPSHAYLFHGPAGSGKASAARAFAAELLAEGSPDPERTRARVMRGAHPDLTWVVPTGAAIMRVEDIEEPVVGAASRTPFEAQRRVFVLEGVDTMNDQAANRMLKTLEEPPSFAHLVLLTDRPGDVLPTIASRCQPVRFDAAPPEAIEALLSGRVDAGDRARLLAARARRRRSRARAGARRGPGTARRGRGLRARVPVRRPDEEPVDGAAAAREGARRRRAGRGRGEDEARTPRCSPTASASAPSARAPTPPSAPAAARARARSTRRCC